MRGVLLCLLFLTLWFCPNSSGVGIAMFEAPGRSWEFRQKPRAMGQQRKEAPRRAGGASCALHSPRARCGFISDTQSLHTSEVLGPSRLRGAVSFPVKMQGSQGRKAFSVQEKSLKLGRWAVACGLHPIL